MIPLSVPNFEGNEEKYALDAVSQGWVSTGGAYVERFEQDIASYVNAPMAVACQSGTAALHLSLIECGVGINDMVIAPTLTFIAAINPIKYVHAEPIFMDCDDSLCMDPVKLEEFCSKECILDDEGLCYKRTNQKIKAIVVVHVFGNLADMEAIMSTAKKYKLKVIEDATEALGSYYEGGIYKNRMAGTIGDFGAYSFNGNKIITTGGGGAVVGNDKKALEHIKYLSTQAKNDAHFYIHNEVGYNYRMTNIQAALGVAQMEELEMFIQRKNRNFDLYYTELQNVEVVRMLTFREGTRSNKWFYSLLLNTSIVKTGVRELIEGLGMQGVQTRPIWGLIHQQRPYVNAVSYEIESAVYYEERIINVPCSTNISVQEVLDVCERIKKLQ